MSLELITVGKLRLVGLHDLLIHAINMPTFIRFKTRDERLQLRIEFNVAVLALLSDVQCVNDLDGYTV